MLFYISTLVFVTLNQEFNELPCKFNVILAAETQTVNNIKWDIVRMHTAKQKVIRCNPKLFTKADEQIKAGFFLSVFNGRNMVIGDIEFFCQFILHNVKFFST